MELKFLREAAESSEQLAGSANQMFGAGASTLAFLATCRCQAASAKIAPAAAVADRAGIERGYHWLAQDLDGLSRHVQDLTRQGKPGGELESEIRARCLALMAEVKRARVRSGGAGGDPRLGTRSRG